MDFIKKSIAAKLFVALSAVFVVLAILDYFILPAALPELKNYLGLISASVFFLAAFFVILFTVIRPLGAVFKEIKALISGHPYKKIFTKRIDEVGALAHFFNDVTNKMEKLSVDIDEGKRMARDLEVASSIQQGILPKKTPDIQGITIFGNTRAASEVGGDSFDFIAFGNNFYTYVGDVTGHGLPAALIMIMVNTILRTFCEIHSSGYDILTNTNRILKQRIEQRKFMTCVLLRWNTQEQKLYYTGAGHEHILIFRRGSAVCEVKQTGGIALGMVPDISRIIKEEQIPLESGDCAVLYSDGIIEAKNVEGEMFGLNRLKQAVEQYAATSTPQELFAHISKDFGIFVGEQIQEDDITLIVLKK